MPLRERVVALLFLPLICTVAGAAETTAELADANGCKLVLYSPPPPGTQLKWDGACADGYLTGPGTADLGILSYRGEFTRGLLPTGEVTAPNGYKYVGELVANQPQGRGESHLPSGRVVRGQYQGAKTLIGVAEVQWADGRVYTGELEGLYVMHGKGKLVFPNGTVFEGWFVQNDFHGPGKLTRGDGGSYEGEFAHGKYHGHGTLIWGNESRYVGEFVAGQQQGTGRLEHPDGTIEEGEWRAGRLQGKCHIQYSVGGSYQGECLNGQKSGQGKLQNPIDGSEYEGEFLADQPHGYGRRTQPGYVYEGQFAGGVKSGTGKEVFESGEQYEGTFARNIREGSGVYRRPTAAGEQLVYEGAFKSNVMHGAGKLQIGEVMLDGEFKLGIFSRGRVHREDGRVIEIDIEQDTMFEILPDGAKVPYESDQAPQPEA